MKILVCISNVPDTTSKITFTESNTSFNENGIQFIINPYDEIALAKAIELAANGNGTVTVLNVGEASTEATIRKALACGADQAVRINAAPRDAWFVANQIANYVRTNPFDLILTGQESIDYNGAQVQSYVAELLSLPSVAIAKKLDIISNEATIEREIEGGKEILTVSLPVVVGTAEGVAEPKIANVRGIMDARKKPLDVIDAVDVSQLSKIINFESPTPRGTVNLIDKDNVAQLVELLHREAKVI
ncbi:electron transfer flavoprotein subunit beta/FixA family protein [Sphingobacterium shayense]|uniref:electron transfer flavoprotein subunit beta/FixA family protein n=1 Tax=Sphingobacterium shayense TaxID=626343 RepID=UPI001556CF07|nr:electron transfer flavoprotein subunit beta/FixA family protein [Sphingobacterium shayense]NQD71164.1 electron transfer flavoprotein subunit beta/FixA family protein [Sphingobacterium shayense]